MRHSFSTSPRGAPAPKGPKLTTGGREMAYPNPPALPLMLSWHVIMAVGWNTQNKYHHGSQLHLDADSLLPTESHSGQKYMEKYTS